MPRLRAAVAFVGFCPVVGNFGDQNCGVKSGLAVITSPTEPRIGSDVVVGGVVAFVGLEVGRYVHQRPVKCGKWGPLVKFRIWGGGCKSSRWGERRLAARISCFWRP